MKSRSTLVTAALDEVAMLRVSDFRRKELITAQLLREYGESSDLTNQLWFDLSAELRVNRRRDISDLLGLWIWRTPDNGSRIRDALDDWLRACDDESKVWIALHRESVHSRRRVTYLSVQPRDFLAWQISAARLA